MKQSSQAISVRVKHLPPGKYSGQRQHDLRLGRQPNYVDPGRSPGNRILVEPLPVARMREITLHRRNQGPPQRAMRSDSAIATTAIITFGKGVQPLISGAAIEQQDAAYRAVAAAICIRYDVELRGLVVHADEAAPHAHAVFDCRSGDGRAVSKQLRGGELQDLAAAAIRPHFPEVTRGVRRAVRKEAGEPKSKWVNRSVRQLHQDLPAEIAAEEAALTTIKADCDIAREDLAGLRDQAKTAGTDLATAQGELEAVCQRLDEAEQQERALAVRLRNAEAAAEEAEARIPAAEEALAKAGARVIEMEARVRKLEDKLTEQQELTEKEAKRLATYQKRLADRQQEVKQAEETLAGLQARINTAEAELTRTRAEQEKLEPVLKQTRASLAEARQEIAAFKARPVPDASLLTRGLRQKEADIEARAVERAAMAGVAYERRKQALEDEFTTRTQDLETGADKREAALDERAAGLDRRESAIGKTAEDLTERVTVAARAIAEELVVPCPDPGDWWQGDRFDQNRWNQVEPVIGKSGGSWPARIWGTLRDLHTQVRAALDAAAGRIAALTAERDAARKKLPALTADLTAARTAKTTAERERYTARADLATALPAAEAGELRGTSARRLLILGARSNSRKMIAQAIGEGADLDRKFGNGGTALHHAVVCRHPVAVEQLLKAGADPAVQDANGQTPADLARTMEGKATSPAHRKRLNEIIEALDPPEPEQDYANDFSM